jgi:hypothetical protein
LPYHGIPNGLFDLAGHAFDPLFSFGVAEGNLDLTSGTDLFPLGPGFATGEWTYDALTTMTGVARSDHLSSNEEAQEHYHQSNPLSRGLLVL